MTLSDTELTLTLKYGELCVQLFVVKGELMAYTQQKGTSSSTNPLTIRVFDIRKIFVNKGN